MIRIWRWKAWMRAFRDDLGALNRAVLAGNMLSAKLLVQGLNVEAAAEDIRVAEFRVFSQFGEDGIIQYLIQRAKISNHLRTFVEFGASSYLEANTRFLLQNNNWRGLLLDGSEDNIQAIRTSPLYWSHDLAAISGFVDRDNINALIEQGGFNGEIGLLSIDIDGNDYWVWESLTVVDPIIVIIEYNGIFGAKHAVSIPYDQKFRRSAAHYSRLYWGCSLKALEKLGRRKGYALVGTNSAGNNAFFLRRDHLNGQRELTTEMAFIEPRFRESRDQRGRFSYLSGEARLGEIADLSLVDVECHTLMRVGDLIERTPSLTGNRNG